MLSRIRRRRRSTSTTRGRDGRSMKMKAVFEIMNVWLKLNDIDAVVLGDWLLEAIEQQNGSSLGVKENHLCQIYFKL